MKKVDRETYKIIADYIFKREDIRQAVEMFVFEEVTLYKAEIECKVTSNTLYRYVKLYNSHVEHLDNLGYFKD
ncbi:hypothetical protein [Photobacterium profundum]|uniref:hypothetical protein n=1 Tax=Photobacterium profundum TaxID=74109 RepID=UPI00059E1500|nr:hypothetical protein [Photobacterium profundum]